MAEKASGSSSDAIVLGKPALGRHHGSILDIIATLEQYSLCERESGSLPEETVTRVTLMNFLEVGIRHGFATSLPLLISAPLGFAVINKILPLFGKDKVSFIDTIYALALSGLPALATIIFLGVMFSLLYQGNITRKGMNMLFQGLLLGKFAGHFLVFVILHIIYYFVIKGKWIYEYFYDLYAKAKLLKFETAKNLAEFVYSLGTPVIQAAWYTAGLFIAASMIILGGYWWGKRKSKKLDEFKAKWLLD